jgi:hypothetical protein
MDVTELLYSSELSLIVGVHIGARALYVFNFDMVWLFRSPTLAVRRRIISSFKRFLPPFTTLEERGRGSAPCEFELGS